MKLTRERVEHLYELALQNFQPECCLCQSTKKLMEKYLGEKEVRRTKRIIKKNPYYSPK